MFNLGITVKEEIIDTIRKKCDNDKAMLEMLEDIIYHEILYPNLRFKDKYRSNIEKYSEKWER